MASLLYPGRGTTINVISHGQRGGITAGQVTTGGPPPPGKKPPRTKRVLLWCSLIAVIVPSMTWLGVGPFHIVDILKAWIK